MSVARLSRVLSAVINSNYNINPVLCTELVYEVNMYCQETEIFNKSIKNENEMLKKKLDELECKLVNNCIELNTLNNTIQMKVQDQINRHTKEIMGCEHKVKEIQYLLGKKVYKW